MKFLIFYLVLFAAITKADDITTLDGKTYKGAKVITKDTTSITILYSEGGAKIPVLNLSDDLQKKYGYDPAKAQQLAEDEKDRLQVEQYDAEIASNVDKSAIKADAFITQVVSNGFLGKFKGTYKDGMPIYSNEVFVECDTTGLADNTEWTGTIWKVGNYSYSSVGSGEITVIKYTAVKDSATLFYVGKIINATAAK